MPRAMPTDFAETSPRTSSPATTMESVSPTRTFNLGYEDYIAILILLDLMEVKAHAFSIHPADQEAVCGSGAAVCGVPTVRQDGGMRRCVHVHVQQFSGSDMEENAP